MPTGHLADPGQLEFSAFTLTTAAIAMALEEQASLGTITGYVLQVWRPSLPKFSILDADCLQLFFEWWSLAVPGCGTDTSFVFFLK